MTSLPNSAKFHSILKPSLTLQHFITASTENISLFIAPTGNISNIILARQWQCRSTLIYWNLSFLSSILNISFTKLKIGWMKCTPHSSPLITETLPDWIVVKAGRSTLAEFWWVGFYGEHYITTKILSHLRSEILRFDSFQFQSHHRVFPVTLNVFRSGFRLSRLFLELRDLISLYFSETSVQVDMARVQGETARHILWDMKRNVQKFKQRLQ